METSEKAVQYKMDLRRWTARSLGLYIKQRIAESTYHVPDCFGKFNMIWITCCSLYAKGKIVNADTLGEIFISPEAWDVIEELL